MPPSPAVVVAAVAADDRIWLVLERCRCCLLVFVTVAAAVAVLAVTSLLFTALRSVMPK